MHIHPAQSFQHSLTNFADNCFTQFMCRNLQFSKTELHFARDNARRDSWSLVRAQNIFMINKILSWLTTKVLKAGQHYQADQFC